MPSVKFILITKFKIHLHSEGVKFETTALVRTFEGLYIEYYHSGKANVVADALSRKSKGMVASIVTTNPHLLKELKLLQVEIVSSNEQIQLVALQVASSMVDEIKKHQQDDPELVKLIRKVKEGSTQDFSIKDGVV